MRSVRTVCSLIIEATIAVAVPVAWLVMLLGLADGGLFSAKGLTTLKYFTIQSNLLGGAASLLTVVFTLLAIKKGGRIPQWLSVVRLVAAAGLMLTFLTVAAFLGPLYGYGKMFLGSNLWFHLIVPLLCAGGVLLLRGERIPKKHLLFCLAPILLYGAFYLGNIAINGVGTRPNSNDWYSLLNWGIGVGLFLLAGMLVFLLGSGALLRLGYNRNNRK